MVEGRIVRKQLSDPEALQLEVKCGWVHRHVAEHALDFHVECLVAANAALEQLLLNTAQRSPEASLVQHELQAIGLTST